MMPVIGLFGVTDSFDDAVACVRPSVERRTRFAGAEAMIAVDLSLLAFDMDRLPAHHVPLNPPQRHATALLDDLHASAHANHRQAARFRGIEERVLGGVPLRSVAAKSRQVIASGQHQSGHLGVAEHRERHFGDIRQRQGQQSASGDETGPRLIQAIAALAVLRDEQRPVA